MRDAAADLDFEKAARLRDEIKRLREMELAISDDPMARDVEALSPSSGREKGKHNKGVAKHRTVEEQERFRKLDAARAAEAEAKAARPNLFAKPSLDEMGTSGDHATPVGAVSRSLFKKQSAAEAHGSDYGTPDDGKSLFRKNSLDEMTVRRTEKPVEGRKPTRPPSSSLVGEDSSPREAKPSGSANLVRGTDDPKPIRRERAGVGSYEDPADQRRQSRRTSKTGRPGR
jgi:excinuclease ABC subunit B